MTSPIVTNDELMKIYADNRSINHNKSLKQLWTQTLFTWWLRNDVSKPRGRRFHSRKNTSHEKYSLEFISTFRRNSSLSLEELVPVMVSK